MYNDKNLTCADCGQEFVFTASEQDFYAQRGFTEPRRCPSCRASRKAARNAEGGGSSYGGYGAGGGYSAGGSSYGGSGGYGSRDRGPREMFTATCSSCGKEAQVPVPPDQRQARLLQRLLPHPARRLTNPLGAGRLTARRTSSTPTQVVSRPGSFDSRSSAARQGARSVRCSSAVAHAPRVRRPLLVALRLGVRRRISVPRRVSRSGACRPAARGRTCAPCRGAAGRCCRRGPAR